MAEEVGSNIEDGIGGASTSNPGFEVSEEKKPVVGMKFESLDEVFEFYNRYAKKTGFSVRKHSSVYWKNSKELMMKYYVCSQEGTNKTQVTGESKKRHGIVRVDCNAKLVVSKQQGSTIWVISQFVEEHNHILTTPHNPGFDVSKEKKPMVGMQFQSLDEVFEFYNRYAKKTGFSVRKHSSAYWKNSKELMMKYYVCSKEGTKQTVVTGESKRRHKIVRVDCNAKVVVYKQQGSTIWVISQFVEEHNHVLTTPHKVHFLKSHREVSTSKKQLSQRDLRKEMDGHEVELLQEHFTSKQEKNSTFYFKMEVDENNRLDRCFWADASSRRAYGIYGDVVLFYITYNTNRYDMKFAPFVGVNKHGQTMVFACAFLSNEKIESFLWLFDQFKKAMPAVPPKMIITDQDTTINNAVAEAFPETFHRFSIWHIQEKFSTKLDATNPDYDYEAFHNCIWNSETPKEFDSRWAAMVEKTKLVGNVWLTSIFQIRSKWVPAYVNHIFSAGMSSNQQVESTCAFFKRYVSKKNSLFEFIIRFNRALAHQRRAELEKDDIDLNSQPVLKSPMPIERQMASIYTRKMFHKFQDELWASMTCILTLVRDENNKCEYNVIERKANGCVRDGKLVFERDLDYVGCSCKKFESEGITCRHVLAYLKMAQFEFLPKQYICNRWTKTANSEIVLDEDGTVIHDVADNSLLMKKSKLSNLASKIVDKALSSDVATQFVLKIFESTCEKINSMEGDLRLGNSLVGSTSICGEHSQSSQQQIFNDPLPIRGKGSGKRLRS